MGIVKELKDFMFDIESKITNKEDLSYIKSRFQEMENRIINSDLEQKGGNIEKRLEELELSVKRIEEDIYDDEPIEFDIICPFCNFEFGIDLSNGAEEAKCPSCNQTLELDWTGNAEEQKGCCKSGCGGCGMRLQDEDM